MQEKENTSNQHQSVPHQEQGKVQESLLTFVLFNNQKRFLQSNIK